MDEGIEKELKENIQWCHKRKIDSIRVGARKKNVERWIV